MGGAILKLQSQIKVLSQRWGNRTSHVLYVLDYSIILCADVVCGWHISNLTKTSVNATIGNRVTADLLAVLLCANARLMIDWL